MKTEFISIRISEDLKNKLKSRANKEKRTIANEALYLMEKGFRVVEREAEAIEAIQSGNTTSDMLTK